jgi:hypothetical protein
MRTLRRTDVQMSQMENWALEKIVTEHLQYNMFQGIVCGVDQGLVNLALKALRKIRAGKPDQVVKRWGHEVITAGDVADDLHLWEFAETEN